ncbi:MAG: peptide-methionine (R)-S-oxide reductase MsrB [Flavobacteriales bacterium]|nr:peptide-methionine (R)-S-oxide reductase MsrB [Flavobacteriales bacterium]
MTKFKIDKSDDDWKNQLTEEQYRVLRQSGTERAFTGKYDIHFEHGAYHCAGCKTKLFESGSKFDSGCGWPSFYKTAVEGAVIERVDKSFGTIRTEVLCGNCGGHLGHVFPDGPTDKTGLRYCINSTSLGFKNDEDHVQNISE